MPSSWGGERIDRRVDCGLYPEEDNRVLLPIAVVPDSGYGRLRVTVRADIRPVDSGTEVALESEAVLDPPYFERGDRASMACTLTSSFVARLQRAIAELAIRFPN